MRKYDYKKVVDYYPSPQSISLAITAIKDSRFPDRSYADIGAMMGTSRQHTHKLFTNGRIMTLQNWQSFCDLFDMNLSAIFRIIENPTEKIPRKIFKNRRVELLQCDLDSHVLTLYENSTVSKLHKRINEILKINPNNIDYMVESPSIISMSAYAVMGGMKLSVLLKKLEINNHGTK